MANLKMTFVSESSNFFKMFTQGSWANSPENYRPINLCFDSSNLTMFAAELFGDGYLNTESSSLSFVFSC